MATWRHHLERERKNAGDMSALIAVAPDEAVLDVGFDDGFGGAEGPPVLAWSEERVYFPLEYDGEEYMGSAPRNPQAQPQTHK